MKKLLAVNVFLYASAQTQDILELSRPENSPEGFYAVTEIPAGGTTRYKADARTGLIIAGRLQSMPVVYPANYGSLTQSLAGDGDPLDVIFYTRALFAPGTLIRLCVIGVLKTIDGGEKDDKIVAVPTGKINPIYDDIKGLNDLPRIEIQRLEFFFRVYKNLPEGHKKTELNGFNDAATTKREIRQAWDAWKEEKPQQ